MGGRKTGGSNWRNWRVTKAYLVTYNLLLAYAWGSFLWAISRAILREVAKLQRADFGAVHSRSAAQHLIQVEFLALLDVLHALLKLTRSSPAAGLLLLVIRLGTAYFGSIGTASFAGHPWTHAGFAAMAFAWSLADVIRYLVYLQDWLAGGRRVGGALTWLRYNLFLVLIPVGAVGETLQMVAYAKHLQAAGSKWSYAVWALITLAFPCIRPRATSCP